MLKEIIDEIAAYLVIIAVFAIFIWLATVSDIAKFLYDYYIRSFVILIPGLVLFSFDWLERRNNTEESHSGAMKRYRKFIAIVLFGTFFFMCLFDTFFYLQEASHSSDKQDSQMEEIRRSMESPEVKKGLELYRMYKEKQKAREKQEKQDTQEQQKVREEKEREKK